MSIPSYDNVVYLGGAYQRQKQRGESVQENPLSIDERIAIARAPLTLARLGFHTCHIPGKSHAGTSELRGLPVYDEYGRRVGVRAIHPVRENE